MNRSLLLVICDFLLLSLLALARFDEPEDQTAPEAEQAIEQDAMANQDLIDVLKMSLDAEQEQRDELSSELKETQEELEARAKALAEREAKLEETQQTAEQLAAEKERLEKQRADLAKAKAQAEADKAKVEAERAKLAEQSQVTQEKLAATEADRVALAKTLAEVKETAATSTERLRAIQDELAQKQAAVDKLAQEREALASQVKVAELEKQTLATQLEVTKAEAATSAERLALARRDIEITRQEKANLQETTQTLAKGVGQLAESTDQIRKEVKRAQPLSLNTIFDRYQKNRVRVTFSTTESGLLGSTSETYTLNTVLVRDSSGVYVLIPSSKTPFTKTGVKSVTGRIEFNGRSGQFNMIAALTADPRILALRVQSSFPQSWGITPFNLATDPLKFPQAILVNEEGKYGEVKFKIVPAHPEYLDMDASIFSELFGEFAPRDGDLVFSQTGELIGVMINNGFGVIAPSGATSSPMQLGGSFKPSELKAYQDRLRANNSLLPPDLR